MWSARAGTAGSRPVKASDSCPRWPSEAIKALTRSVRLRDPSTLLYSRMPLRQHIGTQCAAARACRGIERPRTSLAFPATDGTVPESQRSLANHRAGFLRKHHRAPRIRTTPWARGIAPIAPRSATFYQQRMSMDRARANPAIGPESGDPAVLRELLSTFWESFPYRPTKFFDRDIRQHH